MIRYRSLRRQDVKEVQAVALRAWKYSYRNIYSPKTIARQVAEYYSDKSFDNIFSRLETGESWFDVALDGGLVVGYANGGRRTQQWTSPFRQAPASNLPLGWELFRIYLLPEYIGKGIGRRLLLRWELFLRKSGVREYTVYVHSKNKVGKDFYRRSGLVRARKLDRGPTSQCFAKEI